MLGRTYHGGPDISPHHMERMIGNQLDQASKAREPAVLRELMLIHAVIVQFLIFIPSFLAY
jgi:hypothetical protein